METSLSIITQEASFSDLVKDLHHTKVLYLTMRAWGLGVYETEKICHRGMDDVKFWRDNDEYFRAVEKHIVANRNVYEKQAGEVYFGNLNAKAKVALMHLIDKATDWDALPKEDKPYVWKAIEMITHSVKSPGSGKSADGDYEELVHTLHRKITGMDNPKVQIGSGS